MKEESLPKKREEISLVQTKFFDLQEYFWKKEVILDESSVSTVQSFIDVSIKILSNLQTSIASQNVSDHQTSWEQWNTAFQTMKDKLSIAKEQLKNDFRMVIENRS